MRRSAALLVTLLWACGGESGGPVDAGGAADVGVPDARAPDAGAPPDGGGAEDAATGPTDAGFRLGVELDDGTEIVAERVAVYDHSRWWTGPSDERTWALFALERLAPWPDDRSMAFVPESRVLRTWMEPAVTPFRDVLRDRGVTFSDVPLRGIVYVIAGRERHHLEEDGYGDFAWDLVRTDETGARFVGDGTANEDYLVWGEPVYAPARGYVVEVVRDAPDLPPGTFDLGAVNNMVGLQIFGGYYLYLLHFQQGSVPDSVTPGVVLERGTFLGLVGNAGVSLEPHLHVTALALDHGSDPLRTWSVPSEFEDVWVASTRGGAAERREHHVPIAGEWIGDEPFTVP